MNKLLAVLGPTATGKTDLAIRLAKIFNGELVSCDSRQVYKRLEVGTGKYPGSKIESEKLSIKKRNGFWEIDRVKVWMYDLVSLDRQYTVSDYAKDADYIIQDILGRKKLPIIVGGTGLYLKALLYGLSNLSVPIDKKLRTELERYSKEQLQEKLKAFFPTAWDNLNQSDKQNPRRLLRSIELSMYGHNTINHRKRFKTKKWNTLQIGLTAPREILYKKVDLRILDWFKDGIVSEVRSLLKEGILLERFTKLGLGYKLVAQYLEGQKISQRELKDKMQSVLHGYVKRQQTWFKKEVDVTWFDVTDISFTQKIEKKVREWYDLANEKKN